MKFIGIDFGWLSGASGLCALQLEESVLFIESTVLILEADAIIDWVAQQLPDDTPGLVAVDAPTIIPNETGTRLPDRLTHKYFGKYHAGCYPANLGRPFAPRTTQLGRDLEQLGFAHAPMITPQAPGRYQIEVFPHPAMVHLFHLDRIIKYKKGKLGDRRSELLRLASYIKTLLPSLEPALQCGWLWSDLTQPIETAKGKQLKQIEDQIDALICAYVGAYWWYWGSEKNRVLGDRHAGYIIVPAPHELLP